MKKLLFLLIAGLMVGAFIIGCGTEDPWVTEPDTTLELSIVSGPADTVQYGSSVEFSWISQGGVGAVTYQYRLGSGSWSTLANTTSARLDDLVNAGSAPAAQTFSVRSQDAGGQADTVTQGFWVGVQPGGDVTAPTAAVTHSPVAGSYIATGSNISFAWEGSDAVDGNNLLYQYYFAGVTSAWVPATTITYSNISAANPAVFWVVSKDQAGNMSVPDSVSFIIQAATILYVDDYEWLDLNGVRDMPKERDEKQFYRDALEGYAFAEWDISLQGMPDSAYIITFSTVVWASDSYLGDAAGTWWYDVGAPGESSVHYFMDNGGHLLVTGANILQWIYNSNPPQAGDFEFDWLGIDSTAGWDYWGDFTWAVSAGNYAVPDSMKIDVGKNGDQTDMAEDIFAFRDSAVVVFTKGLDVDGAEPYDYGESVGHIYYPGGGAARSAMINFDTYSMPLESIKQTFGVILTEFGE